MKQLFLTCGFVLLMVFAGGCSKDDEPDNGNAKAKGNIEIDGHLVNLRYAYVIEPEDLPEYFFYDIDVMKFLELGIDDIEENYSCLYVDYDNYENRVTGVSFDYNVNGHTMTGTRYVYHDYNGDKNSCVSFSKNKEKVKISSEYLPMIKLDYKTLRPLGDCTAFFSVEGNPKDMSYMDEEYAEDRKLYVLEVTHPKQIAFLRSLRTKTKTSKIK